MKKPAQVIIIDDDETTNMLCTIIIRHALGPDTEIKTFTLADDCINYLKQDTKKTGYKIVMFLDINMPVTTGWDALHMFDELDSNIKQQLSIFMLSSSINLNDKKRALEHSLVVDFIEKPLTIEKVNRILEH